MKYQNLDELLYHTCRQIEFIDNYRKTEYKDVLLSMYVAVDKHFKENLKLIELTNDNKLEKKKIKYLLRKLKRFRKKSWKKKIEELSVNPESNSLDMFNFDFESLSKEIKNQNIGGETESANTSNNV